VHAQEVGVQGHGKSDGLQAYIPSFNVFVDDYIVFFECERFDPFSTILLYEFFFPSGRLHTVKRESVMCVCV
jgi:hypothetical protein